MNRIYVRCYASSGVCWDDGFDHIVAAYKLEDIEKYVQFASYQQHPYDEFIIDQRDYVPYDYGHILLPKKID